MRRHVIVPLAGVMMVLAACGGRGGGGFDPALRDTGRVLSNFDQADPNAPAGGAVASVARLYQTQDGRIRLDMIQGPLAGMVILCENRAAAECHVNAGGVGATGSGTLTARRVGNFAYVGQFVVSHDVSGVQFDNIHSVHGPNPTRAPASVRLPGGVQQYSGQFAAGASVGNASGMASGTATLLANFDTATVSGTMNGALDTAGGPAVTAVFNGLRLDRNSASFRMDDAARISFGGARAWGEIDGAFYGPNAQEAAGAFSFGNSLGGMSGVFLTCQQGIGCIQQ